MGSKMSQGTAKGNSLIFGMDKATATQKVHEEMTVGCAGFGCCWLIDRSCKALWKIAPGELSTAHQHRSPGLEGRAFIRNVADRRVVRGNQSLRFLSAAGLPEPRPSAVSEPASVCVWARDAWGIFRGWETASGQWWAHCVANEQCRDWGCSAPLRI